MDRCSLNVTIGTRTSKASGHYLNRSRKKRIFALTMWLANKNPKDIEQCERDSVALHLKAARYARAG